MSEKIDFLVGSIVQLTLVEARELKEALEECLNVKAVSITAPLPNVLLVDLFDRAQEIALYGNELYDIWLEEAPNRIAVIKAVRQLTTLGLKEAKELVENVPSVILTQLDTDSKDRAVYLLTEAGAIFEVRPRND